MHPSRRSLPRVLSNDGRSCAGLLSARTGSSFGDAGQDHLCHRADVRRPRRWRCRRVVAEEQLHQEEPADEDHQVRHCLLPMLGVRGLQPVGSVQCASACCAWVALARHEGARRDAYDGGPGRQGTRSTCRGREQSRRSRRAPNTGARMPVPGAGRAAMETQRARHARCDVPLRLLLAVTEMQLASLLCSALALLPLSSEGTRS